MRDIKKDIVPREFFREGDVVINKATGCVYIYVRAKGFSSKVVIDV